MISKIDQYFLTYPPSLAAAHKLGEIPDGFMFYEWEWIGDNPKQWTIMKVTGAVFREAKSGPRKGERVIKVSRTQQSIYVTSDEINKFKEK